MVDIKGTSQTTVSRVLTAAEEAEQLLGEVVGVHDGEEVELEIDALTIAEELKEEIGHLISEEMENELGREERRVEKEEKVHEDEEVEEVDGDPALLPDISRRKGEFEELGREMMSKGMTNPDDILEYLRENLGKREGERGPNDDPTLQYGALSIIEKMFSDSGESEMAGAVGAAAAKLLSERGHEINRGMIVSEAAALYTSERFGSVSELRSLYIDEVVGHKGIPSTFTSIIEKYGDEGFTQAIAFLLRAAGDDLSTMKSNTDRAQQKEVLDNLYQLEVLNTMRERTDGVLVQLGRSFTLSPQISSQKIMRETLGMIENPQKMNQGNITRLSQETVPDSLEGRISFLREFRTLVNMVPLKVFDGVDQGGGGMRLRERLGEAVMDAQDVADAEEQEKLSQQ